MIVVITNKVMVLKMMMIQKEMDLEMVLEMDLEMMEGMEKEK